VLVTNDPPCRVRGGKLENSRTLCSGQADRLTIRRSSTMAEIHKMAEGYEPEQNTLHSGRRRYYEQALVDLGLRNKV